MAVYFGATNPAEELSAVTQLATVNPLPEIEAEIVSPSTSRVTDEEAPKAKVALLVAGS